ncbi:MAG TPA: hypothetical protein PLB27_08455 [Bacteroidales bacterium]|nr:hypothetical protein [Bacteroidales bacterium]
MTYIHKATSFDQIREFVIGRSNSLPPHLETLRKRWTAAFTLMLDRGLKSERHICKQLMTIFNISEPSAYNDIAASKRLFGDAGRAARDIERYLASENAKELYQKAWTMFMATKEYHWFVAATMQQKIHYKVNGLDKDDPDLPDPAKINPPVQVLQINIDFIRSQFAQFIDPKAKEKINALLEQIDDLVINSRISDYLNTTIEIPRIKNK